MKDQLQNINTGYIDWNFVIAHAFKRGWRMWSPNLPFTISQSRQLVLVRTLGGLKEIPLSELTKDKTIIKVILEEWLKEEKSTASK